MKKTKKHKILKKSPIFLIPTMCICSLSFGIVTFSFGDKQTSTEPNSVKYQSMLSSSSCDDNELYINSENNYEGNFAKFPEPRYRTIPIESITTSYNMDLYHDMIAKGSKWVSNKNDSWLPISDVTWHELYDGNFYKTNKYNQNMKMGFKFLNNGGVQFISESLQPASPSNGHFKHSGGVWLNNYMGYTTYDVAKDKRNIVSAVDSHYENRAAYSSDVFYEDGGESASYNYFGLGRIGINQYGNYILDETRFNRDNIRYFDWYGQKNPASIANGINCNGYNYGLGDTFYPTTRSYTNGKVNYPMLVVRLKRNIGFKFGWGQYVAFQGQFYDYDHGLMNNSLQLVIENANNSDNYLFRMVDKDGQIGLTGSNNLLGNFGDWIKYTNDGTNFAQNLLLTSASNLSQSSARSQELQKLILFGSNYERSTINTWGTGILRANLPVFYSPSDSRWYLLTDRFLYSTYMDYVRLNVDVDSNFKNNEMKNIYPSEFITGIKNGRYSGYDSKLRISSNNSDYFWTTPSSWWRYVPQYKLKSDNKNGNLYLDVYMPYFDDKSFSATAWYNNHSTWFNSKSNPNGKIWPLDRLYQKHFSITISGFKNVRTSFTNVSIISLSNQFSDLASNISQINLSSIENAIKSKYISNIENYVNNSCYLKLRESDIILNYVSNDLISGNVIFKIKLKKYVNSNGSLIQNTTSGIEKNYTIGGFYKINGKTTLNNSAIDVSDLHGFQVASSINGNSIKDLIIKYQNDGIKHTINTNYQDHSKELFSNLGNLLLYNPSYLTILEETNDDDNGVKYVKFRLSKIYDTSINNSHFLDGSLEGNIVLYGFKRKNSPINNYNSTTIYADNNGYIGVNNDNQVVTPIDKNFSTNFETISDNKLVLSQQYVPAIDSRATLVYDPTKPNKIVIDIYNGSKLVSSNTFDAPVQRELVLRRGTTLYYNNIDEIINRINAVNLYTSNNTKIPNSSLGQYVVSRGSVDGYSNSFYVNEDIYGDLYVNNSLAFNRLIDFNNDDTSVGKMFLYNQSPYSFGNQKINDIVKIVDFNTDVPSLSSIDINNISNSDLLYDAIYSASGYYGIYDNKQSLYISFIKALNKKTIYQKIILDPSNNKILSSKNIDITSVLNLYGSSIFHDAFYFQMPEFITKNVDGGINSFVLATIPGDNLNYKNMKQRVIKISEKNNNAEVIGLKILGKNTPITEFKRFVDATFSIFNSSFSSNGNEWLATIVDNSTSYFLNVNVNDVLEKNASVIDESLCTIMLPDQNVLDKNDLSNNWIYSLNNNNYIKHTSSTNIKNNVIVSTRAYKKTISIKELGDENLDLLIVDNKKMSSLFANNYWSIFTNKNFEKNDVNVTNIWKNYADGSAIVNVNLSSPINNSLTNNGETSFEFIVTGFKKYKDATSINLTRKGLLYFSNINISEIDNVINRLVKNKDELNSYFNIVNHPYKDNLYDSLNHNLPIVQKAFYDPQKDIAYVCFNLTIAFTIAKGESTIITNNQSIYVGIHLKRLESISNLTLEYNKIFSDEPLISPSELRELILNNSSTHINKIKKFIHDVLLENNYALSIDDILLSNDIQYDNGIGELYLKVSIPKLIKYSEIFSDIKVTIKQMKTSIGTTISKRQDYKRNINPSKLNEYLNQDVENRSLEFINIENKRSDTKVISARVLEFDDEKGTAKVSFSVINFNISGLNQSGSSEGMTLNAIIDYIDLKGVNSESLTNVKTNITTSQNFANQYAQVVASNNSALISILKDTNAIYSLPQDAKISVLSSTFNNKTGEIYLSFKIDKYISNSGDIVNKEISFNTTINGFKSNENATTISWNNVLPDLSYEDLILELKTNPNYVKNLININNMVEGTNITYAKAVMINENTTDIYLQIDKCFSGDKYNTIINESEFKITIIRNGSKYLVSSYSLSNDGNQLLMDNTYDYFDDKESDNIIYKYWYLFVVCPMVVLCFLILGFGLIKKFKGRVEAI